ncbi:MAG: hypothetical protein R3E89_17910 [Thiolinea sp.]
MQASDFDVTGCGFQITGEHFHDGGFTGPVVPKQTDHFTAPDFKRHVVYRFEITVMTT